MLAFSYLHQLLKLLYLYYICVNYFDFNQDVKMLVSTGVIVARHAPPIVRTTSVTYRVDRVLNVNLDGLEGIVTRVGVGIRSVLMRKHYVTCKNMVKKTLHTVLIISKIIGSE